MFLHSRLSTQYSRLLFNRKGRRGWRKVRREVLRSCGLAVLLSLYSRNDCMTARLHDCTTKFPLCPLCFSFVSFVVKLDQRF
jgi:hypothetical protein